MQKALMRHTRFAIALLVSFAPIARSQAQPTPHTPDLLGIYTGMPSAEARVMLQKHSGSVNVTLGTPPDSGFGLHISDPKNPDQIDVRLTAAPNDPEVWMIQRSQIYSGRDGTPLSLDTVLNALRQKYGKETMTMDRGGGGLYVFWIFDQSGRLLPTGDPNLQGCDANQIVTYMGTGVPKGAAEANAACYKSFFAVKASFNRATAPFLNGYSVELVNLPLAYRAAMITGAAKNAGADKARQDELDRANKNKPTF